MEKLNSRQFCYWLKGAFDLKRKEGKIELSSDDVKLIQENLNSVFKHDIDPSYGDEKHQQALSDIHNQPAPDVRIRC